MFALLAYIIDLNMKIPYIKRRTIFHALIIHRHGICLCINIKMNVKATK